MASKILRFFTMFVLTFLAGISALLCCLAEQNAKAGTASNRFTSSSPGPQKWALLIGINRYKHSRTHDSNSDFFDLHGAVNDIVDMEDLLVRNFAFEKSHIRSLRDGQATRSGILTAISEHLIANTKSGDIVVIHYSGHGSQAPNPDLPNGADETIVPQDARGDGSFDITGTELSKYLKQINTENLVVILDSCHSGDTFVRNLSAARGIPPDKRKRPLDSDSGVLPDGTRGVTTSPTGKAYVLIAASTSLELANEGPFGTTTRGALTYSFTNEIRRLGKDVTYGDVMEGVRGLVTTKYPSQHPQLSGALSTEYVFNDRSQERQRYILASPLRADFVSLEAGEALGVTAGSKYDLYPPQQAIRSSDKPIASFEITSDVQSVVAEGKLDRNVQVLPNSRAVERAHNYGKFEAHVYYPSSPGATLLQSLKDRLSTHNNLGTVSNRGDCDIEISEVDQQLHVNGCAYPIKSPPVSVGRTPDERQDALAHAEDQVIHLSKWLNLLALNNSEPGPEVDFSLEPVGDQRALEGTTGAATYYDGGKARITVKNKSALNLYIAILDFGSNGNVTVVYPGNAGSQLLYAGRSVTRDLPVAVPTGATSDTDVLKLFVTTTQRDFRKLELEQIKGDSADFNDPLGALFLQAAFGNREVGKAITSDEWMTTQRLLQIVKRDASDTRTSIR